MGEAAVICRNKKVGDEYNKEGLLVDLNFMGVIRLGVVLFYRR